MSDERYEKNRQERIALGLHPKGGWQSLDETRRILMTWPKADLIEFCIRDESDALKAIDRAIEAEQSLREHRAQSFTMPKPTVSRPIADPERKEAFERWKHPYPTGTDLSAEQVFNAGWNAHSEAVQL